MYVKCCCKEEGNYLSSIQEGYVIGFNNSKKDWNWTLRKTHRKGWEALDQITCEGCEVSIAGNF